MLNTNVKCGNMPIIIAEDVKIIKCADGSVKIEIVNENVKKELVDELVYEFAETNEISKLEKAILIDKDYLKDFIFSKLSAMEYYIDNNFILAILNNLDTIEKKLQINLRDKVKEVIEKNRGRLDPEVLLKTFEILNYDEQKREEIIRKYLEAINEIDISILVRSCDILKNVYPDIVYEVLNNKMKKIFEELNRLWYSFYYIGKGWEFEEVKEIFLEIVKVKDLLSAENKAILSGFLLSNNIDKLIKKRIKKDKHNEYIKAILEFLPQEMKTKYIVYLL